MSSLVTDPRSGAVPDDATLAMIGARAGARDAAPAFPDDAFAALAAAGALLQPASRAQEWAAVRAVAAADGSVGRLYEGHLNAVERLSLLTEGREGGPEVAPGAPPVDPAFVEQELAAVAAGKLLLGVWGADPAPGTGEGEPAYLVPAHDTPTGLRLHGAKIFCSGAGGLRRALVTARGVAGTAPGPPVLVYVDLAAVAVDRDWYRASGMRASESHRVDFAGAPVLAVLGVPGELVRQPWFATDAIRTAAAWAGMTDAAADAALAELAGKPDDDLRALAAGRIETQRATITAWFEAAGGREHDALPAVSVALRAAVARAATTILDEAGRACGSRPFATGAPLDRIRRDLELFLLQHRLDPMVARQGRAALEARR